MYFDSRQPPQAELKKDAAERITAVQPSQLLSVSKAALADHLRVSSLANLATVTQKDDVWHAHGGPTEIAIQVFASRHDTVAMTVEFRQEIMENMEALAGMGLHVLALASKRYDSQLEKGHGAGRHAVESDLTFRGSIGFYDPPRAESAPVVRSCHEAGIAVHMLTGDHPETAKAIAIEVGILPTRTELVRQDVADAMVMTASKFDALTDDQVDELPVLPLVIARCAPDTITGDGVNDSPSLRRADVRIAMGQAGSEVAEGASDVVLADDNFASIVAAIEEGRRIFDNILKFVLHLLAENIAQAGIRLIGLIFKDARRLSVFPLFPVEIVWIIMITSGMPDMGLGFEQAVPGIMNRPPQNLKTGIFDMEFLVEMVVYGVWIVALCLASFCPVLYSFGDGDRGENCNEYLATAWEMVDRRRSFFRMQPGSKKYFTQWMHDVWRNKFLFWAIVMGFLTMFPILYIPVLNTAVFKHTGIS
ncbi:hypothetical protein DL769_005293 [Monosporascus sp. CRB-8-3]|nr:hypothetical protein DL769_005293 [Monosporascus sp. CRB-8-3]